MRIFSTTRRPSSSSAHKSAAWVSTGSST
jgi:hypothetical protein